MLQLERHVSYSGSISGSIHEFYLTLSFFVRYTKFKSATGGRGNSYYLNKVNIIYVCMSSYIQIFKSFPRQYSEGYFNALQDFTFSTFITYVTKNPMSDTEFKDRFSAFDGYSRQEYLNAVETQSYEQIDHIFVPNVWERDSRFLNELLAPARRDTLHETTNFFEPEWIMDIHRSSETQLRPPYVDGNDMTLLAPFRIQQLIQGIMRMSEYSYLY